MALTPTTYTPDEDAVSALITRVDELSGAPSRNCFAGPVEAFTASGAPGLSIPKLAVFVTASGGSGSRFIRSDARTVEQRPVLTIRVRSSSSGTGNAFEAGQALARKVQLALQYNPPSSNYCECVSFNSYPTYLGRDDDGLHEWLVMMQLIVDVVG